MLKCCFCFDLKTGSIASAVFVLVTRILGIIGSSLGLKVFHPRCIYYDNDFGRVKFVYCDSVQETFYRAYLGLAFAASVLAAIFSIILIFAVKEGKKCLFWPWIIYMAMELSGGIVVCTICFISENVVVRVIALCLIPFWTFHGYMLHCVVSYYQNISSRYAGMSEKIPYQQIRPIKPMQNYFEPMKWKEDKAKLFHSNQQSANKKLGARI